VPTEFPFESIDPTINILRAPAGQFCLPLFILLLLKSSVVISVIEPDWVERFMLAISRASWALFLLVSAVATTAVCPSTAVWADAFSSPAVAFNTSNVSYVAEVWVWVSFADTARAYLSSASSIKDMNSSL